MNEHSLPSTADKKEALKCLGNSILNDCQSSQAILKTLNYGDTRFVVEGGSFENCSIRMEYGSADQIQMEAQKQYANTYLRCAVHIPEIIESVEDDNLENYPGSLTVHLYFFLAFMGLGEDPSCENGNVQDLGSTPAVLETDTFHSAPSNEKIKASSGEKTFSRLATSGGSFWFFLSVGSVLFFLGFIRFLQKQN
jgi:hypothetical protein